MYLFMHVHNVFIVQWYKNACVVLFYMSCTNRLGQETTRQSYLFITIVLTDIEPFQYCLESAE